MPQDLVYTVVRCLTTGMGVQLEYLRSGTVARYGMPGLWMTEDCDSEACQE